MASPNAFTSSAVMMSQRWVLELLAWLNEVTPTEPAALPTSAFLLVGATIQYESAEKV
jgi:hypothetical protein